MTAVINLKHTPAPSDDYVYVGRPSKWGNPFVIGVDGTRKEVIQKYKQWLCWQVDLYDQIFTELKDKVLGCWCAPHDCHADVLARIADADLILLPFAREELDEETS